MQENGIQPDVVTCCSLISALENGGEWLTALQLFIQMCSGKGTDNLPSPLQATGARLKQVLSPCAQAYFSIIRMSSGHFCFCFQEYC